MCDEPDGLNCFADLETTLGVRHRRGSSKQLDSGLEGGEAGNGDWTPVL